MDAAAAAAAVGDHGLLARAALANNRGWASATGQVDAERVAVLEQALAAVDDDDPGLRARLLATLCAEQLFGLDFDRRLALADEAESLARRSGDDRTLLEVLVRVHESIVAPQTLAARLAWTDEAVRLSEQLGDPVPRLWAQIYRYLALLEAGQIDGLSPALEAARVESAHLDQPSLRWPMLMGEALDRQVRGSLDEAEAAANDALQVGLSSGQPDAMGGYGMQLITVRFMQGRMAEMVPLLEQTREAFAAVAATRAGLALGYTEAGDLAAATAMLDTELANGFDRGIGSGWLSSHAMWAVVAFRTGRDDAARLLHDLLAPYADQYISSHITVYGAVAFPVGLMAQLLGRPDEAVERYQQAIELDRRLGSAFYVAWALVTWAELLEGRDEQDRAAELAGEALDLAGANGFAGVARQRVGAARTARPRRTRLARPPRAGRAARGCRRVVVRAIVCTTAAHLERSVDVGEAARSTPGASRP